MMYQKGVILGAILSLGLLYPKASVPVSHPAPPADLVAVINMSPADPLGGEIYLMKLDGKVVRRLTQNRYHEESPRFSPDGNRIVFVRAMGGLVPGTEIDPKDNEIFVYDLRAGREARLTHNQVEDGHPEWSFDGRQIAFHSRRDHPEGRKTIWVMASDGSRPRQVSSLRPGDLSHTHPVWSPDGHWLAFVNHREEGGGRYTRIEKIRLDGTQRTVVSSGGRYRISGGSDKQELTGDLDPVFSPDAAMIWSARRLETGRVHLFSFSAGAYYGGKAEMDMNWPVRPAAMERAPRFSPDGRRIVLSRLSLGAGHRTRQIVLTDPQSSFRRYLTSREDWDAWHPSWHPFANSGVEREGASVVASYATGSLAAVRALPAEKDGDGPLPSKSGKGIIPAGTMRPADSEAGRDASYETIWSLDAPSGSIVSMALRFHAKIGGESGGEGSLRFQLMDWQEKRWVTVFAQPNVGSREISIVHEFAPANFVSQQSRQVALRVLASSPGAAPPSLEAGSLSLDVRR